MEDSKMMTKNKVSAGQKIAFGFGMLANQMFPAALGVFIIVLVQDLGFAAILWGIIQFCTQNIRCDYRSNYGIHFRQY